MSDKVFITSSVDKKLFAAEKFQFSDQCSATMGIRTPVVRSPPNVLVMTLLVAASVPSDKVCIASGENELATAKHLNLGCDLY